MTPTKTPFSLTSFSLAVHRDGKASILPNRAGPPPCVEGLNIGLAEMSRPPPHNGEMHPDGDEILYLIDGAISVVLEENPERTVEVKPGESFIVPRGIWHRLLIHKHSRVLYMTPGPGNESRPLKRYR